jgi:hypothetical protein
MVRSTTISSSNAPISFGNQQNDLTREVVFVSKMDSSGRADTKDPMVESKTPAASRALNLDSAP